MFTNQIFTKIFVKISSIFDAIPKLSLLKARYSSALLLGFSFLIFCSCSTTKTIPIETIKEVVKTDTLYINNVQYDSIYVSQDKYTDRSSDTILIKETSIEYRYKMLRDTVERVKIETVHDSIPYEVRITETIEVEHSPSLYDRICKASFWLLICFIAIYTYLKLKRH